MVHEQIKPATRSVKLLGYALLALWSLSVLACEGGVPSVFGGSDVVPHLAPPSSVQALRVGQMQTQALRQGQSLSGLCDNWQREIHRQDAVSGEFEYLDLCTSGGEIASVHTQGIDNGDGSGQLTITYEYRDGHLVHWQMQYQLDAADRETTHYLGQSDQDERFAGDYRPLATGETEVHEWLTQPSQEIETTGLRDADGRFNGHYAVDVLETEQKPDWTLDQEQRVDGTLIQVLRRERDGWLLRETLTMNIHADEAAYGFRYDDLSSAVLPDIEGAYILATPGSVNAGAGQGGYTRHEEDGSELRVEHQLASDGAYHETWRYDDVRSPAEIDQEGWLDYNVDGYGAGELITYVVGGSAETCDIHVDDEGQTRIDHCK